MSAAPASPASHLGFVGTTTEPNGSQGLYALTLDTATGTIATPELVAETASPNYLALSTDHSKLYALSDAAALAVGFKIVGAKLERLAPAAPKAGAPSSHLALDATGRLLVCSNYHDGTVATVAVGADGVPIAPPTARLTHSGTGPNAKRQEKPHPHSAFFSPDNRFVYVCDLGADKVYIYRTNPVAGTITPAEPAFVSVAPGSGPRHSVASSDGKFYYVVNELGSRVDAYARDAATGALTLLQGIATLPADFTGESITAEIRLGAGEKFLYVSNRGHESIAVFARDAASGKLTLVEIVSCHGKHPRNFSLTRDGSWLIVSNRESHNLAVFRVETATGKLTFASETALRQPMCSVWLS